MNKLLSIIYLATVIILIFNASAFATGPADAYKVKLNKVELYNGTGWVTVFEGTSPALDIASVSSGSSPGAFLSGLSVPDGTYTQVRVTPSPTFTISGHDGASYTTATAGIGGGSTPGTAAQETQFTLTLTGANVPVADTQDFSATPITVTGGVANHKVRVNFDVSNAIQTQGGELWPAPPVVTMSVR